MHTVGIIYNSAKTKASAQAQEIGAWLKKRDCVVHAFPSSAKRVPELNFALSLGGDGTMLRASKLLAPLGIPVLGINLGSLGFLAETDIRGIYPLLTRILSGDYDVDQRMLLNIVLVSKREKITRCAVNDCVIHSGTNGRIIRIGARVNNEFLADYLGDGLIISTPTGSTAYSLAASGPIVHPHLSLFVVTPICPHTLAQRPLILSDQHAVVLTVATKSVLDKPILTLDGQETFPLTTNDQVHISASDKPVKLIVNPKRKYFEVLRAKLKWGERG